METIVNVLILVGVLGCILWVWDSPFSALSILGAGGGAYIGTEMTHSIIGTAIGLIIGLFFGAIAGAIMGASKEDRERKDLIRFKKSLRKKRREDAKRLKEDIDAWQALPQEVRDEKIAAMEKEREEKRKKHQY